MSEFRPYRAAKFRGLIVVAKGNAPISVNNAPMFCDGGSYIDNNLDLWDSYSDKYGSSSVTHYRSWEGAWDKAERFNDEYEPTARRKAKERAEENERRRLAEEKEEERKRQEEAEHWRIVDELRAERKRKIKAFVSNVRNIFKNKRAV